MRDKLLLSVYDYLHPGNCTICPSILDTFRRYPLFQTGSIYILSQLIGEYESNGLK